MTSKVKFPLAHVAAQISPGKVPFRDEAEMKRSSKAVKTSLFVQDGKRRQLQSILETEKTKEEKGKLGCILIDRLIKKFTSKHSGLITFFVEEFLSSHESIDNEDIEKLEREISNTLDLKKPPSSPTTNTTMMMMTLEAPAGSAVAAAPRVTYSTQTEAASTEAAPVPAEPSRPPSGAEWQIINAYQMLMSEQKDREEKEHLRLKKLTFKKSLDDHIKEKHTYVEDKAEYATRILSDIERYNLEEKMKFDRIRKKNSDESQLRQLQVLEKQRKIAEEKAQALMADKMRNEATLKLMQDEQDRLSRLRKEKVEAQAKIQAENAENERLKELKKLKDAEEDQAMMKLYAEKLDREAVDRENAFKNRMMKDSKRGEKYESGTSKLLREEQLRSEQLLLKEQQLKEERELANQLKKETDQKKRTQLQLMYNERMIERKRQETEQSRLEDVAFKERAVREAAAFRKAEEDKYTDTKKKQEQYRETLSRQVAEHDQTEKRKAMDPIEKQINMPILKEVLEDKEMLSRVMHRMRLSKSAQMPTRTSKAPF